MGIHDCVHTHADIFVKPFGDRVDLHVGLSVYENIISRLVLVSNKVSR